MCKMHVAKSILRVCIQGVYFIRVPQGIYKNVFAIIFIQFYNPKMTLRGLRRTACVESN